MVCCEDGWVIFQKRNHIDKYGAIVRVTIPNVPEHYYYLSENWIHNQENSPIPPYVGPVQNAPKDYYGPNTYVVDKMLTEIAHKPLWNIKKHT